jgi:hypothetical protein
MILLLALQLARLPVALSNVPKVSPAAPVQRLFASPVMRRTPCACCCTSCAC